MGAAYTLSAAGGLANFYGVSWTYDGPGYPLNTGYGIQHCMAVANAGTVYTVIGQGIWTAGGIRANGAISAGGTVTGSNFSGSHSGTSSGTNTGDQTNISGNSATATALSSGQSNWSGTGVLGNVVGLLAWKNYGNNHVIFDASASTTPSGGGCSSTNSTSAWTATYPTLMGWNGSQTYGVRVDSARISDSTSGNAATATYATSAGSAPNAGNYNPSYGVNAGEGNGSGSCNSAYDWKLITNTARLFLHDGIIFLL